MNTAGFDDNNCDFDPKKMVSLQGDNALIAMWLSLSNDFFIYELLKCWK